MIGTVFSECETYRYTLERTWEKFPVRYCMFLMLNPSTADDVKNDPTIIRCVNYAKAWGYDGLYVGNLYGFRATQPQDMWYRWRQQEDIIGPDNDMWLRKMARKSEIIVAAWGSQAIPERVVYVRTLLNLTRTTDLHYLQLCANGMPSHPLYLNGKLKPQKWKQKR
jgi:hypothetical protein